NHATQTAERLRSTAFTGDELAVLQVDNQHDDATTQAFLRYLDKEHSPIRIIVSVNKLREGWDTKRIAVMCTLRAMGSEVLTQQVMGRGIRLPFGQRTGVETIDELDIISHKSFVSLLKTEDILREFGIESDERPQASTVLALPGTKVDPQAMAVPTTPIIENGTASTSEMTDVTEDIEGKDSNIADLVGSRGIEDDEEIVSPEDIFTQVEVSINEKFQATTFLFPSTVMEKTTEPFELADLTTEDIIAAAKRTKNTSEQLERTRVAVVETGEGAARIHGENAERVSVESFHQSERQVANELTRRVLATGGVSADVANVAQLSRR